MGLKEVVAKLDSEAEGWVDELGVPLPLRTAVFLDCFHRYVRLNSVSVTDDDYELVKFIYYNYWFIGEKLDFRDQMVKAGQPFVHTVGRLDLLWGNIDFSAQDATFVTEGFARNKVFRATALALIGEFTRESRQLLAIKLNQPIFLGSYNLLLAALEPSAPELYLHAEISAIRLDGEEREATRRCQMGACKNWASWLVICSHGDGREYLCASHKTEEENSFSTYRLIFSNSCGHHVDRRDCRYISVGNSEVISLHFDESVDD